jgi:formate C-acetyltransferase
VVTKVKEELYVPDRIQRLKKDCLASKPVIDIDRMKFFTESYKQTEGELPAMRAAKGLEMTLKNMKISISNDELIVGVRSSKKWGRTIYMEGGMMLPMLNPVMQKSKKAIEAGTEHPAKLSAEEMRTITEDILPYWRGKTAGAIANKRMKQDGIPPEWFMQAAMPMMGDKTRVRDEDTAMAMQGHVTVGIEQVINKGFKCIARQAAENLTKLDKNEPEYLKKKDFLEAVQVCANAMCMLGERYAQLAEEMAKKASPSRRIELLEIAKRCRRVPAEPPTNFMEAVQSAYFTQLGVLISYGDGSVTCPGRIDQYLYPSYKKDIEAGRITSEQALEDVMEYSIKVGYTSNGPNDFTIGGVDRNGEDAVNEVSYLFLEAHRNLKGLRNSLAVRIAENTPREFLMKACEVHRVTAGISFYNDKVVIRDLMEDGYSIEDARDYGNVGCTEVTGCGNNNGYTASAVMFHVACLEMALNEGGWSLAGWKRVGAPTPPASTFKTFEDVKKAFSDQIAYDIENIVRRIYIRDQAFADYYPQPLLSATIVGCVESGKDITSGGAKYSSASIGNQGLATQADSLAAIKWAVFDKKLVTMEELVQHLRNNFKGAEELHQQLLNAPKYGNDDPYVDDIAVWIGENFLKELKKHPYWMGGPHRGNMISSATQTAEGMLCGATPDGRLARTTVSNGISPTNQMERNGLTAALCSGARASTVPISDGTSFNANINPSTIMTDEGLEKFAATIEGYFAIGGRQVQFNPVTAATLRDAQAHPENYPELLVKVTGFSARFIELRRDIQNDIIARTEFASC